MKLVFARTLRTWTEHSDEVHVYIYIKGRESEWIEWDITLRFVWEFRRCVPENVCMLYDLTKLGEMSG